MDSSSKIMRVLPHDTLINIVKTHKSALETAIGANISDVESWSKPTESPTAGPAEPSSNNWKWIGIGIGVGVVGYRLGSCVRVLVVRYRFCYHINDTR